MTGKVKVGILEYQKYHQEYIRTLANICHIDGVDITIFKDIKEAQKADYLDLLFVNTIQPFPKDYMKWIRFKPKCRTILTIHEANSELKNKIPFKKTVLNKFDAISVALPAVKDYIVENDIYDGEIYTIPFMLHEEKTAGNGLFVVPGQIACFRRDYTWLFKKENLQKILPLYILGTPVGRYGKSVIKSCKKLFDNGYPVYYHDSNGYIPAVEYTRIIRNCTTIVAPLRNPTEGFLGFNEECYGKTKVCGSMFEAIKYGKNFICNLDIKLDYKDFLLKDWQEYFKKEIIAKYI